MADSHAVAVLATDVAVRSRPSTYPQIFASLVEARTKRALGDFFGLTHFGVNLTILAPGGMSSLRHAHRTQDEFIYVLAGTPTLITNEGETVLFPGMCAGFKAGTGNAHHLVNRTEQEVTYLEIGDRSPKDVAEYPDEDIKAELADDGHWRYLHKDGRPY